MTRPLSPRARTGGLRRTGGDPSRLRRLNAVMTIHALRTQPSCTISDLARLTGLSRPAVEDVVNDLVDQGWAELIGTRAAAMGRPARRYRFRAAARHVLGLDIGAHKIRGVLADLDGTVQAQATVSVQPDLSATRRLSRAGEVMARCLREVDMAPEELSAVAAATTGLVDDRGVVTLATGIADWAGVDVAEWLRGRVPCPVFVENDTKLAAVAEQWRGAARGVEDIVYVLAGLRTAASLIIGGQLHRGTSGSAGEIGLLSETRWGLAQDHLTRWSESRTGGGATDPARAAFDAARLDDPAARAAVRRYSRDLAVGVAMLVLALDPELVVIGGGYSAAGDALLEPLRRELEKRCLRAPNLVRSELGGEAPVYGAIRLALDAVESVAFAQDVPAAVSSIDPEGNARAADL